MARVPKEELQRLEREVSMERAASTYGVTLTNRGDELFGRCPMHEGDEGELVITVAANTWSCGTCKLNGTVIDWVRRMEGVGLRHAVELLQAGLPGASAKHGPVKSGSIRKLVSPVQHEASDAELLKQVVAYFHGQLKQSQEALAYLGSRGLLHPEVVEHFKLGFGDRTLGLRLPMKNREAGAEIRGRLQKLGIFRESGHEQFTGSLVVPILDEHGNVAQIYGRKVTPGLRPGTPLHVHLAGGHRRVWNLAALAASPTMVLCQSIIDGLTLWCAGYRNVTATCGHEGFTDDFREAFKLHGTEKVLIAFRRDEAGDLAAQAVADKLTGQGVTCYRVQFPKGLDANEYALKVQPAAKSLGLVLRNAVWMGKGTEPNDELVLNEAPMPATEPRSPPGWVRSSRAPPPPPPAPEPNAELIFIPNISVPNTPPAMVEPEPSSTPTTPLTFEPAVPGVPEVPTEVNDSELAIQLGDRRYRVRGLAKNMSFESLKVNLLVSRSGLETGFHVDTLELYAAKARAAFTKQAAAELGLAEEVVKHDLGKVLLKLETLQEQQIREALKPKDIEVKLDDNERSVAMGLLTDAKLLDRVLVDFERCGVIGEENNKLVGYLAAVSRKLDDPLAVLIQSSSAAGKTSLMDAILATVPAEDLVQFSAMTGQSLFYMGETNLKHKVLAIAEEEGAARASYALKLLQSEKHISIASTAKEPTTGRLVTQEYRVEGPTQLMLTTTAIDIDEELLNRCVVLTVDEERRQTRAIHQLQREGQTLEGMLARNEKAGILKVHQDAQRLLRPLLVVNPFARELTFLDDRTRTRRDHLKYLTLIRAITLLHQYQRQVKTVQHGDKVVQYIEATPGDIAVANRLADQVLGRSLDELPPQTRRLLIQLDDLVREACAKNSLKRADYLFTRRQVREALGWGNTQLKVHLHRLAELEYVLVHRSAAQGHVYELLYDGQGQDGGLFLQGLFDAASLKAQVYDVKQAASDAEQPAPGRPPDGGESAASRPPVSEENPKVDIGLPEVLATVAENSHPGTIDAATSQSQVGVDRG